MFWPRRTRRHPGHAALGGILCPLLNLTTLTSLRNAAPTYGDCSAPSSFVCAGSSSVAAATASEGGQPPPTLPPPPPSGGGSLVESEEDARFHPTAATASFYGAPAECARQFGVGAVLASYHDLASEDALQDYCAGDSCWVAEAEIITAPLSDGTPGVELCPYVDLTLGTTPTGGGTTTDGNAWRHDECGTQRRFVCLGGVSQDERPVPDVDAVPLPDTVGSDIPPTPSHTRASPLPQNYYLTREDVDFLGAHKACAAEFGSGLVFAAYAGSAALEAVLALCTAAGRECWVEANTLVIPQPAPAPAATLCPYVVPASLLTTSSQPLQHGSCATKRRVVCAQPVGGPPPRQPGTPAWVWAVALLVTIAASVAATLIVLWGISAWRERASERCDSLDQPGGHGGRGAGNWLTGRFTDMMPIRTDSGISAGMMEMVRTELSVSSLQGGGCDRLGGWPSSPSTGLPTSRGGLPNSGFALQSAGGSGSMSQRASPNRLAKHPLLYASSGHGYPANSSSSINHSPTHHAQAPTHNGNGSSPHQQYSTGEHDRHSAGSTPYAQSGSPPWHSVAGLGGGGVGDYARTRSVSDSAGISREPSGGGAPMPGPPGLVTNTTSPGMMMGSGGGGASGGGAVERVSSGRREFGATTPPSPLRPRERSATAPSATSPSAVAAAAAAGATAADGSPPPRAGARQRSPTISGGSVPPPIIVPMPDSPTGCRDVTVIDNETYCPDPPSLAQEHSFGRVTTPHL
ncbi:hypothetical protein FOA52_014105 [Chlamydomonas sp. UWO 241]|nr:hypothetical protein FOA52_014105 [Chlamydomonas sp. UWO 241]